MNNRWLLTVSSMVFVSCGTHDTLLVASGYTDEVVQVRASDGEIVERIAVDPRPSETDEPHGLALAPDGRHWYASVSHGEPTLWKFELPDHRLVGRLRLGTFGAGRVGITPDGETALVPDYYRDGGATPSHVAVVRLHDLSRIGAPIVCPTPHDAAISPDGSRGAVTCVGSDEIVILETASGDELDRWSVDSNPGTAGFPRFRPMNAVWSPETDLIYVTLHGADVVRAFDPSGGVQGEVNTGAAPAQLAISPDGSVLVTANRHDGTASIIALPELVETRRVQLDITHPHGIALDSDGRRAFITYEGDTQSLGGVVAIAPADGEVLWRREVGAYTTGVIYLPE